jgi:hypothetical protein
VTYLAGVITLVCLVLLVMPLLGLVAELLAPWPKPREHHDYVCPECPCSYAGPAELARHVTHQHGDQHVFRLPRDGGPAR